MKKKNSVDGGTKGEIKGCGDRGEKKEWKGELD